MGFFRPPPIVYGQILTLNPSEAVPDGFLCDIDVDVTSRSRSTGQQLSPFLLGPVPVADGPDALSVENLWQFSKCYDHQWDYERGCPLPEWWAWRNAGFADPQPHRYPMGKGVKPVCTWWNGEALDVGTARQQLYGPSYMNCATRTGAWRWLLRELRRGKRIVMRDFGVYDVVSAGVTYDQAIQDSHRPFGHAMFLAAEMEKLLAT